ncbi:hypothetical protein SVIOM342S_03826 [Streptomyces violaceorubidus]
MTVRRLPALSGLLVLAALLTGCGIRATEVPTDYGPAPSRVRCSLAEPDVSTRATPGLPAQVFLLCGSSLVAVDRTVRVPDGASDSGGACWWPRGCWTSWRHSRRPRRRRPGTPRTCAAGSR